MPHYLYQGSYAANAIKAMLTMPSDREAAARKLIESAGGKLHYMAFAFGSNDLVAIIEMPDDKSMAATAMAVASSGAMASASTTKLISMDDARAAMQMGGKVSGSYKPPAG